MSVSDILKLSGLYLPQKKYYIPLKIANECLSVYERLDLTLEPDENYYKKKSELLNGGKVPCYSMKDFIDQTKNNLYSGFIYGNNYLTSRKYKLFDDIKFKKFCFISFSTFNEVAINRVCEIIRNNQTVDYLILDIRDNIGGSVTECIKICNLLLPECPIVELTYKDKKITYLSDKKYIPFKSIYILLNKESASCSEILALTLKKNQKNVYLIGNETAKKSVGQSTFINHRYKSWISHPNCEIQSATFSDFILSDFNRSDKM